MVALRPFIALRPPADLAAGVVAPPYDVVDVTQARSLAQGRPDSFLHVSRPEIDLADADAADAAAVHRAGRAALDAMVARGALVASDVPVLLVYRQTLGDASRTGVVGLATVADYRSGAIAVHEHTRPDKEDDRTEHVDVLDAHDEPVLLMHPDDPAVSKALAAVASAAPDTDVTDADGVRHELWRVDDQQALAALVAAYGDLPRLYVADGHHRSAAAARVHERRTARGDASEGSEAFAVVAFPAGELVVLPYDRLVADLAGRTPQEFLAALGEHFEVTAADGPVDPDREHRVAAYLDGGWWLLDPRPGVVDDTDPVGRLDVAVLQRTVLGPLLGIEDPRRDARISFAGGGGGARDLAAAVDAGRFAVAFHLRPTTPGEVMAVADASLVMPPKSTWFEPKLGSGLFVHRLS